MKYKAVIFDLDGTLLNTLDDLADSVNYVLDKHNFPLRTKKEIRSFVGNGIYKLIERSLPDSTEEKTVQLCYAEFSEYYKLNMMNKTHLYDGIEELTEKLKKSEIKLAIVTNKANFAAQELCKTMFGNKIDIVIGSDRERPNKPAPDSVLLALKELNVSNSQAVYVGDSEVDAETAVNSNVDFLAVLWGFRDLSDFHGYNPIGFVNNASELEKMLLCDSK